MYQCHNVAMDNVIQEDVRAKIRNSIHLMHKSRKYIDFE